MLLKDCSKCKRILVRLKDYYNLLIKSTPYNYYRIESCKKDTVGRIHCDVSFDSYSALRKFQKKLRRVTFSATTVIVLLVVTSLVTQLTAPPARFSEAASFSWSQTDWSGGADPLTYITHGSSGTTYASSTPNLTIDANGIYFTTEEVLWVQTTDINFQAGDLSNAMTTDGDVALTTYNTNYTITQTDNTSTAASPGTQGGWASGTFTSNTEQNGTSGNDASVRLQSQDPKTTIYIGGGGVGDMDTSNDGDARPEIYATCNGSSNKPASCTDVNGFLSISATEEIRDLQTNSGGPYISANPIYWYNASTQELTLLASNWSDMLSASAGNPINASQADGTGNPLNAWSGSNADGSLNSSYNCSGWTASSFSYKGASGNSTYTDNWWLSHSTNNGCGGSNLAKRCICNLALGYYTTGIYTGYVDGGASAVNYTWNSFAWTETLNGVGDISIKVKSSATASAPSFTTGTCDGSASSITLNSTCADPSHRYLFYQATLSTSDPLSGTPTLDQVDVDVDVVKYNSSATYTSPVHDTLGNKDYGNITFNISEPGDSSLTIKVRSCTTSDCSDGTAWGSCTAVASASDLSDSDCVTDGDRYVQYYTEMTASSDQTQTPTLNDVTIEYDRIPPAADSYEDLALTDGTLSDVSTSTTPGSVILGFSPTVTDFTLTTDTDWDDGNYVTYTELYDPDTGSAGTAGASVRLTKSTVPAWFATGATQNVRGMTYDSVNQRIYISLAAGAVSYCNISSDCDANGDWTQIFDAGTSVMHDVQFDPSNQIFYAAYQVPSSLPRVYRCDESASDCTQSGNWSYYDITAFGNAFIRAFVLDSTTGVIYAEAYPGNMILRCDPSVTGGCDGGDDWAQPVSSGISSGNSSPFSGTYDSTQNALFIQDFRCLTSTGCDTTGEWIDTNNGIHQYVYDSIHNVLYGTPSNNANIYRCAASTGCDTAGEWTSIYSMGGYMTRESGFNPSNGYIYYNGAGNIYKCDSSTGCDASGEWSLDLSTAYTQVGPFLYVPDNEAVYSGANGQQIYMTYYPYNTPGTYRAYIDAGVAASYDWKTFKFDKSTIGLGADTTSIQVRVRSNNSNVTPPSDISSAGCLIDSSTSDGVIGSTNNLNSTCASTSRYLWIEAALNASSDTKKTPSLDAATTTVDISLYQASGTYTSPITDTGGNTAFTTINWTENSDTNNTDVTVKVRTCDDVDCSGETVAKPWSSCAAFGRDDRATTSIATADQTCITNGDQYVQYQATLTTTDTTITPELQDVTINYVTYTATTSEFISAWFNTTDLANNLAFVNWTENTSLPAGTTVKLQVQTAPDAGSAPGTTSNFEGVSGDGTYFESSDAVNCTNNSGAIVCTVPALEDIGDGTDDQWMQYKITIDSDNGATPLVSSAGLTYVVNAPPDVENVSASQVNENILINTEVGQILAATGTVVVSFDVLDPDTFDAGAAAPEEVIVSMEYSTNGGSAWNSIATTSILGLPTDSIFQVASSTYSTYYLIWDPNIEYDNEYNDTGFLIRVLANDSEQANATGNATSSIFTVDTQNPTTDDAQDTYTAVKVDGRESGAMSNDQVNITMKASDDSELYYKYSLNDDMSVDGTNANSGTWIYDSGDEIRSGAGLTITITLNPASSTKEDIIYIQYKDKFDNVNSAVYSVETPERPTGMMIQDVTNTYVEPIVPELFISWKTNSLPVGSNQGEFQRYVIERSTDGVSYSEVSSTTDRTLNYYRDNDLIQDQDYYYRVYVKDGINNISYYSATPGNDDAVLHGIPNGTQDAGEGGGGTPASPPSITSVDHTSAIYTTQATITWNTDNLSDSRVEYLATEEAPVDSDDFASSSAPFVGVASMVSNTTTGNDAHSVTVTGLLPNTNYYYQVKSTDINGNTGTSYNSSTYHFTTLSGPTISSSTINHSVTNTTVTITWTTDQDADSYVGYSTDSNMISPAPTQVGQDDSTTEHLVTISALTPGTVYYYYVKSGAAQDDNSGDFYNFKTSSDSAAPIISGVSAVTKRTSAIVNWETDEDASSKVVYGTSTGIYEYLATDASTTKQHSISLSSLTASTTYYYKVVSTDDNDNTATSTSEYSFTTEGINISNIEVGDITETGVTITWDTSEDSSSQVEYSTNSNLSGSSFESAGGDTQNHSVSLTGLTRSVVYYYRVISELDGFTARSPIYYFSSGDITAPNISSVSAIDININSAVVTWTTNEPADSYVEWGAISGSYGLGSNTNASLTTTHSLSVTGLTTDTLYYYHVVSADANSNSTTSPEYSFRTSKLKLTNILASSIGSTTSVITWETDEAATSQVEYTANSDFSDTTLVPSSPTNSSTTHSILLSGLDDGTVYYYKAKSGTESSQIYSFTTTDVSPPSIPNPPSVSTLTDTTATIFWETDELSNSILYYDTDSGSSYAFSTTTNTLTTLHFIKLINLSPSTTYYFVAESRDGSNQAASTSEYSFTTLGEQYSEEEMQAKDDEIASLESEVASLEDQVTEANEEESSGGGVIIIDKTDKNAPKITEVKIARVGDVFADITWKTDENSNSMVGFGLTTDYNYSEFDLNSLINLSTNHSVNLKRLIPNTTYHFSAISTDSWGNLSSSPDYTFKTLKEGEAAEENPLLNENKEETEDTLSKIQEMVDDLLSTGKTDAESIRDAIKKSGEPPLISGDGPILSELDSKSVIVSWKTNRRSNSIISYYQSDLGPDHALQIGNFSSLVTDHAVKLDGLIPGTTYSFTAQSVDALGNIGSSQLGKFTTESVPYIAKVSMANITNSGIEIGWDSNIETTSELDFGFTDQYGQTIVASKEYSLIHNVKMSNLAANTTYHFRVKGESKTGELILSDDYEFKTLSSLDVLSYNLLEIDDKKAKIQWETSNKSTSEISYINEDTKQAESISKKDLQTNHAILLNDLTPGTKYSFVIRGEDEFGQGIESEKFYFTTLIDSQAPIIEYVQTDMAIISSGDKSRIQAIVTWKTDELSTSEIIYTEGAAKNLSEGNIIGESTVNSIVNVKDEGSLTTKHVLVVTEFKPGTVYTFKAKSIDEAGNVSYSKDYSVLTPNKKESVMQIIMNTFEDTFGWLKLGS